MISRLLTLLVPGHDLQLNLAHFHTLNSHTRLSLITVIRSGLCAATVTANCDCYRRARVWWRMVLQGAMRGGRGIVQMIVVIVVVLVVVEGDLGGDD